MAHLAGLYQKKYLNWSDNEIKANREFLRRDKELAWELAQIEAAGPNWREQAEAMEAPEPGMDMGGGAPPPLPAGDLGGAPPDFGAPADPAIEPAPDAPPPEDPPPV